MRLAVIDIGTNSIHTLIVEILPNFTFEIIGREKEMTRLGDGTLSSGKLSPEVMNRGLLTLKKFHSLAQSKGAQKIIAFATSAVREAKNGGDFLQKILEETSIKIRVITGEEEGRLIYLGVKNSLELKKENTLIIDIGGGSVELMIVDPDKILFLVSLKMGGARLKDLFLNRDPKKGFHRIEKYTEKLLKEITPKISETGFSNVIGTSGTLNNLAAMASYLNKNSDAPASRNSSLAFEDLKKLYRNLQEATPPERLEMKGMDPLRNDLILGGAAAAYSLMKNLNIETLAICDKGMREGMIYDYIAKNQRKIKSEIEFPDVRRRNILKLATRCDYDKAHGEQVAKLALQIFDQTQNLHHLKMEDRELLEYASLLHDIGYHISYEKHHRHAYYLIKNVRLNGFAEDEINLLAHVARYHRRSMPKKNHMEFRLLQKPLQERIEWLAGMVRIADALDRSHFSVVQSIKVDSSRKGICFLLTASNDSEYEIWDAKRKCDLFKKLCKKEIVFRVHRKKKN